MHGLLHRRFLCSPSNQLTHVVSLSFFLYVYNTMDTMLLVCLMLFVFFLAFRFLQEQDHTTESFLSSPSSSSPSPYVLLQDQSMFAPISHATIQANQGSNQVWWQFPQFSLGSYQQLTNNIRYPYRTDEGTCQPVSMCNTLYQPADVHTSNHVDPLPPVPKSANPRVGYFVSK